MNEAAHDVNISKALATAATAGLLTFGVAAPASAAPRNEAAGGAAGLIAAVLQVQTGNISVVRVGDVNVAVQNVLNNNEVLNEAFQNFLNNNNIRVDANDVVDVRILNGGIVIVVPTT